MNGGGKRKAMTKRKIKLFFSYITGIMLCVSACGKQTDNVTDYGGTVHVTSESTENSTSAEERSPIPESRVGHKLSDWLGGTKFDWTHDFSIDSIPAHSDFHCSLGAETLDNGVNYVIADTEFLPAYQLQEISSDMIYESLLIQNIFGDTAKEVHRTLDSKSGDSIYILSAANSIYQKIQDQARRSNLSVDESLVSLNPSEQFPSWQDGDGFFWHTWEGVYHSTNYQCMVAYCKPSHTKTIALYPNNPGDIIGRPECNGIKVIDGEQNTISFTVETDSSDEKGKQHTSNGQPTDTTYMEIEKPLFELVGNIENQSHNASDYSEITNYLKKQMNINLQGETLLFTPSNEEGAFQQLLFYTRPEKNDKSIRNAILNGYDVRMTSTFAKQDLYTNFGEFPSNYGSIWVTDQGIIGCNLNVAFEIKDCSADQVRILAFDSAMQMIEGAATEELKGNDYKEVTLKDLRFYYYPISSPTNIGAYTLIPVWTARIRSNTHDKAGTLIINAIDGSLVSCNKPE